MAVQPLIRVNRRTLLLALAAAPFAETSISSQSAGGQLRGRLTSTESERVQRIANFGKAFAMYIQDEALWNAVAPMLDQEVILSVRTP